MDQLDPGFLRFIADVHACVEKRAAFTPAIAGAALGGFGSAVNNAVEARNEGADWKESLRRGAVRGIRGAAVGAALGKGLEVGGRRFAPLRDMGQGLTDYGKKTLHAVTGYGGKDYLRAAGGGSSATKRWLDEAEGSLATALKENHTGSAAASKAVLDAAARADMLRKGHNAVIAAEDAGLTSLPGLAKGLVMRPKDTLKKTWGATVHGLSTPEKVLFGVGTGMGAYGALQDPDPENPRSAASKALSVATNIGMNVATAPLQLAMTTKGLAGSLLGQVHVGSAINNALALPAAEAQRRLDGVAQPAGFPTGSPTAAQRVSNHRSYWNNVAVDRANTASSSQG